MRLFHPFSATWRYHPSDDKCNPHHDKLAGGTKHEDIILRPRAPLGQTGLQIFKVEKFFQMIQPSFKAPSDHMPWPDKSPWSSGESPHLRFRHTLCSTTLSNILEEVCMNTKTRAFVIRQDSQPKKLLRLTPHRVAAYMRRLQTRYPEHRWSISERFPFNGSD